MSIDLGAQEAIFIQLWVSLYETYRYFRGLTGSQRTPRVWGVTSIVSSSIICFPSFIFIFLSNSKYCSNSFSSILNFSMSSLFIVLSKYFPNIICSTIFSVVHLTYFRYFPILIRVFFCISIFIILFSNLFIFSSIFLKFIICSFYNF